MGRFAARVTLDDLLTQTLARATEATKSDIVLAGMYRFGSDSCLSFKRA
jgi:hypothetical protein